MNADALRSSIWEIIGWVVGVLVVAGFAITVILKLISEPGVLSVPTPVFAVVFVIAFLFGASFQLAAVIAAIVGAIAWRMRSLTNGKCDGGAARRVIYSLLFGSER